MEKKYQVFVSSTFEDLIEERQEVMRSILELNCIPTGMELFPSSQTRTFTFIEKIIDDCDYFILIIGDNYGSIYKNGKSYTQMEYEYAILKEIPVISFIKKTDQIIQGPLKEFVDLVQLNIVRKWTNKNDLSILVSRSLLKLIQDYPKEGWVKNMPIPNPALPSTISSQSVSIEKLDLIIKALYPDPIYEKISEDEDLVQIEVIDISPSQVQEGSFTLILGDDLSRRMPIIIGLFEAQAIALGIEKINLQRPLTHNIFANFLAVAKYDLVRIVIHDLIDGIFYAKIAFSKDKDYIEITTRPSDAIALAIFTNSPMYCSEKVLDAASLKENE